MRIEEIYRELEKQQNTVLSFENRGPWGNSNYKGNCSGWVVAYFIKKYGVKALAEIFSGGGTGYDVCKDMGVEFVGIDLNPKPVRDKIISMDILDESIDLPDGFYNADMLFLHPPYPSIHDIKYAGNMWKDTSNYAQKDIQNMSWSDGMKAVNKSIMRGYAAMQPGAYEVVLVGEIRSKGQYRSMYRNLAIPGILHQTYIKMQHNTSSQNRTYGNSDFALTGHEMIAVIKKPSGYEIAYMIPKEYKLDIRSSKMASWKDVVAAVVRKLGATVTLTDIYRELEGHEKCKNNLHWKEKIRQTLQIYPIFEHISNGTWAMAA